MQEILSVFYRAIIVRGNVIAQRGGARIYWTIADEFVQAKNFSLGNEHIRL
jgi:hypothetical protein